jgi:multidrug efflux pump subunit AcrB
VEGFIRFFLDRHLLVDVITLAIVVVGLATALQSRREGFPAVELNRLSVQAQFPGASAEDVELKVTSLIEEALDEIDGIESYNSQISTNLSHTVIDLYDDLNKDEAAEIETDIRRALDAITGLPDDLADDPVVRRFNPGKIPILEIALSGPSDLLPEASARLEQALRKSTMVSTIHVVGVPDPEVRILLDADRARQNGVALTDLISAISRRSVSGTGGALDTAEEQRQVVLRGEFSSIDEVRRTILRFLPDGRALRVQDVARVEEGRRDDGLRVHTNGLPGVSLIIRKRESADIIRAVDQVREIVLATELPPGIDVVLVNDGSFLTRNRLSVMASNGFLGMILVLLTLFLFLTPRTAFWVAVGVPVVLLGVVALFPLVGMTVNLISVAGMVVVLGLLVDDAVVVAERIVFHENQGLSPYDAAVKGATSMARPVTAAAVTTILAFSPMLALGGLPGKIAWNLPATVVLALLVSLIETFVILPRHVSGGRRTGPIPKRRFVVRLEALYRRSLTTAVRWRYPVVIGFFALFLVTMGGIRPRMAFTLFPQDDSDALYLKIELPPGTALERTEAVVSSLERQIPGLVGDDMLALTARIGHKNPDTTDRTFGVASNQGVISILCRPLDRERTSAEWAAYLSEHLAVPPEATVNFSARVIGPPVGAPVMIHVAGHDDAARRSTALALVERLRAIDGVVEVSVDEVPGLRRVDLRPDWDKLALYGLDAELVSRTLKAALHGVPAAEIQTPDGLKRYVVRLDPVSRRSVETLLDLPVRARTGRLVLLRDIVRPVEIPSVATIHHRDGVRTATVTASFAPGSPHTARSLGMMLQTTVFPDFTDPAVTLTMGGEFTETASTVGGMATVALLAVLAITMVIAVMLNSVLDALFVVVVIPFGIAGVILAFFFHGKPLSMFAMLGGIGLAGVVVNTSIVMVDAVKQRLAELDQADDAEKRATMIDAVVERLRPILVTTISTLGGVLPTAYGLGGYDAVLSPMSLALGWGLAFSTLVTLFLVPSLFTVAQDIRTVPRRLRTLFR